MTCVWCRNVAIFAKFNAIYVVLLLNLLFTLFCREISCGEKLSPKVHLWRKNDKYKVWSFQSNTKFYPVGVIGNALEFCTIFLVTQPFVLIQLNCRNKGRKRERGLIEIDCRIPRKKIASEIYIETMNIRCAWIPKHKWFSSKKCGSLHLLEEIGS